MLYSITYKRITRKHFSVYFDGRLIGEVLCCASGWLFRADGSNWVSLDYASSRDLAVVRWPGLKKLMVA